MKHVFVFLKYNVITYVIAYLIKTFVIWEFTNPLQWIIDIPEYTDIFRGFMLFCIFASIILYFGNDLNTEK